MDEKNGVKNLEHGLTAEDFSRLQKKLENLEWASEKTNAL